MKRLIPTQLALIVGLALSICITRLSGDQNNTALVPTVELADNYGSQPFGINDWLMLGPFVDDRIETTEQELRSKMLSWPQSASSCAAFPVLALSQTNLEQCLNSANASGITIKPVHFKTIAPFISCSYLYQAKGPQTVYLLSNIIAPHTGKYALVTGSQCSYGVIVNGKLISTIASTGKWIQKYTTISYVELKEGTNTVTIVCAGESSVQRVSVFVTTPKMARTIAAVNNLPRLLANYIIPRGNPLSTRHGSTDYFTNGAEIRITSSATDVIIAEQLADEIKASGKVLLGGLADGVYSLEVTSGGATIRESFFYGDIIKYCSDVRSQANANRTLYTDRMLDDLELYCARLEFLSDAKHRQKENEMGEREAVDWLYALGVLVDVARRDPLSYPKLTGRQLRTFRSAQDGTVQSYLIYVPPGLAGQAIPLVVVYPASARSKPTFITSYLLDFKDRTDAYVAAATKYGFAVLFPYARNEQHSIIGDADVLEAMRSVREDHTIDPERLYIVGTYSSGRDALMLAAANPRLFAAVAIHNLSLAGSSPVSPISPRNSESHRPEYWGANLRGTPILLTWGQWDERGNIRDSELLGDKWKKDGVPMASLVLEGGSYSFFKEQNEEYLFRQFAFFKDKKTGDVGAKISLVADRNSASHSGWLGFTGNVDTGLSRCDAEVRSPREIEIVEMGVKEIKIDLALAQCELVEPITIHLNGGLAQELRNDGHGYGIISIRQK